MAKHHSYGSTRHCLCPKLAIRSNVGKITQNPVHYVIQWYVLECKIHVNGSATLSSSDFVSFIHVDAMMSLVQNILNKPCKMEQWNIFVLLGSLWTRFPATGEILASDSQM